MKIKHSDILIPTESPFEHCKLEREPIAKTLTSIVESLPDGFVMAIDNKWGSGKTTFVKMWKQHLENSEFKTLYFNAWENDFQNEVIVALLSVFEELSGGSSEKYNRLLSKTAKVMKSAFPIALKGVAGKLIGEETISEVIKVISEVGVEEIEDQINSFKAQKNSIDGFKKSLSEYVSSIDVKKPVVCLIDELDRCRPTYAVEVLEKIKHLFSVEGIVFVLSIDKKQLGNSIKGYYGTDLIDSEEYLRRFIDLNYSMPKPEKNLFIDYLYQYYGFSDFLESEQRINNPNFKYDPINLRDGAKLIYTENYTLRQIERSLARVRLTLGSFEHNFFIYPYILIFLDYLYSFHSDVFYRIQNASLEIQEFIDCIEEIILKIIGTTKQEKFSTLVAELTYRYQLSYYEIKRIDSPLLEYNDIGIAQFAVTSKFMNKKSGMARYITNLSSSYTSDISLNWIIKKFSLTEPVNL